MFAFHWLLFRVMFGFGKNKFTREALDDPNYLRGFLIAQTIPSPLAWHAFRLPRAVLVSANASLFVVEMVLPFLVFFPGWPRLVAAAGFSALMIGIQAMGNWGFFNISTIVLCVPLLDQRPLTAECRRLRHRTARSSGCRTWWPSPDSATAIQYLGVARMDRVAGVGRGDRRRPRDFRRAARGDAVRTVHAPACFSTHGTARQVCPDRRGDARRRALGDVRISVHAVGRALASQVRRPALSAT